MSRIDYISKRGKVQSYIFGRNLCSAERCIEFIICEEKAVRRPLRSNSASSARCVSSISSLAFQFAAQQCAFELNGPEADFRRRFFLRTKSVIQVRQSLVLLA